MRKVWVCAGLAVWLRCLMVEVVCLATSGRLRPNHSQSHQALANPQPSLKYSCTKTRKKAPAGSCDAGNHAWHIHPDELLSCKFVGRPGQASLQQQPAGEAMDEVIDGCRVSLCRSWLSLPTGTGAQFAIVP